MVKKKIMETKKEKITRAVEIRGVRADREVEGEAEKVKILYPQRNHNMGVKWLEWQDTESRACSLIGLLTPALAIIGFMLLIYIPTPTYLGMVLLITAVGCGIVWYMQALGIIGRPKNHEN